LIGIDEVSRRKGQVYLTVVYDLERRVLLWVGEDRHGRSGQGVFSPRRWEGGAVLRCRCVPGLWAAYVSLVRDTLPGANSVDRFHIVKHLQEAVNEVRRMRCGG